MAIYAIFNVATQNRNLADVRMRGFYVEKVYCICKKVVYHYGVWNVAKFQIYFYVIPYLSFRNFEIPYFTSEDFLSSSPVFVLTEPKN